MKSTEQRGLESIQDSPLGNLMLCVCVWAQLGYGQDARGGTSARRYSHQLQGEAPDKHSAKTFRVSRGSSTVD